MGLMGRVFEKRRRAGALKDVFELMNPRTLFVDDKANMRDLLALYLRKQGMEVTTVATCRQAME